MDSARFVQIYIVQGIVGIFFLLMAIKILRRDKEKLHLTLSLFYVSVGAGVMLNIIYASIFDESIVPLLHFLTYFFLCFGQIFLLIFVLIINKSENVITPKVQLFLVLSFSILFWGLWFIPEGIVINETTNWKPVWTWEFLIYTYVLCTSYTFIPTLIYSFRIYSSLETKILKKKWLYFISGLLAYYFAYYGTSFSNALNDPNFRFLWSIISLFAIPFVFLLYHGVGREL
ncbi:MAG: hypothetical protein EU539_01015 [Promethearchaeota archaeon]|nr:MAG: hypothetical protein EU539_01015 [Candidatus Lokiarchaeota archaeon]